MRIVLKRKMYARNPFSKAARIDRLDQKTLQKAAQKELDEYRSQVVDQFGKATRAAHALNASSERLENLMEDAKRRRDNRNSRGGSVFGSNKANKIATGRDARALNKERNQAAQKREIYNEEMGIYNDMLKDIDEGKKQIQKYKKGRGNYLLRGYDRVYNTWDSGKAGKAKVIVGGALATAGLGSGIYYGNRALKKRKEQRRLEKLDEALYNSEPGLEEKEFSFLGTFGKEGWSLRKAKKIRIDNARKLIDVDKELANSQYEDILNLAKEKEGVIGRGLSEIGKHKKLRDERLKWLELADKESEWTGIPFKNKGRALDEKEIERRLGVVRKHSSKEAKRINDTFRKSSIKYRELEEEATGKYKDTIERIKNSEKQLASELSDKDNLLERGYDYVADTWDSGKAGKAKVIIGGTLAASGLAAGGYYGYKALKKKKDERKLQSIQDLQQEE